VTIVEIDHIHDIPGVLRVFVHEFDSSLLQVLSVQQPQGSGLAEPFFNQHKAALKQP
jgi:hypothetical protein